MCHLVVISASLKETFLAGKSANTLGFTKRHRDWRNTVLHNTSQTSQKPIYTLSYFAQFTKRYRRNVSCENPSLFAAPTILHLINTRSVLLDTDWFYCEIQTYKVWTVFSQTASMHFTRNVIELGRFECCSVSFLLNMTFAPLLFLPTQKAKWKTSCEWKRKHWNETWIHIHTCLMS